MDFPSPQGGLCFDQEGEVGGCFSLVEPVEQLADLSLFLLLLPRRPLLPTIRSRLLFASTTHSEFKPIDYPTPDGVLSFDILTSVSRTGTNHAENQPIHLHIEDSARAAHVKENVEEYAGLLGRVCPAAVYEYVEAEGEEADAVGQKLVINSQNCIHCKTCSIKVSLPRLSPSLRLERRS